jgi:hypothetical protein
MSSPITLTAPVARQTTSEVEISSLAQKFYRDNNCEAGHDRENWLCAEYMLAQKNWIKAWLSSIHDQAVNRGC